MRNYDELMWNACVLKFTVTLCLARVSYHSGRHVVPAYFSSFPDSLNMHPLSRGQCRFVLLRQRFQRYSRTTSSVNICSLPRTHPRSWVLSLAAYNRSQISKPFRLSYPHMQNFISKATFEPSEAVLQVILAFESFALRIHHVLARQRFPGLHCGPSSFLWLKMAIESLILRSIRTDVTNVKLKPVRSICRIGKSNP